MTGAARKSERTLLLRAELWRLILPVLWIGMVGAISFIEAPLRFQAPGITIPLGLGIGRLVFLALNIAEAALLIALTLLSFWPSERRVSVARRVWWAALAAVFFAKILVVRPPLNARTDLVLQGADPGQSPWHYVYIACDLVTLVLLVVSAVFAGRAILAAATEASGPRRTAPVL